MTLTVQEELVRRSRGHIGASGKKRNFSSNHAFSQIVFAESVGKYIAGFIGITGGRNSLFGDVLAGLRIQA